MKDPIYITTPIYYVNAEPHLGHAYTTIVADTWARFNRLVGNQVRFQTGTDEHGDKIAEAAEKENIKPKQFADRISGMFQAAWPPLDIEFDNFIRTTDQKHIETVQTILQKVYDAGDIYFAKYGGNYCVGCERFYTDRELVDGKCPDHQTVPIYIEEENYFFRMSKYQDALREHIEKNPDFIRPARYRNEVLSFLSEPLEDLCISRPKTRLEWGITLPFDDRFVTYVWFDALINYLTGLDWPDGENYKTMWRGTQHLIAKDILKPHGIYWPTMLMAAGIPLYKNLNVHGYWNVDSSKMSKSLGNVIKPLDLAQVYGVDAFRYFLMREMNYGLDANFSEGLMVDRYNADLANDLGNLTSRVLNMMSRYEKGVVPEAPAGGGQEGGRIEKLITETARVYAEEMKTLGFHKALSEVWSLVKEANRYVVQSEPWELAKDPANQARLDEVLYNLVQILGAVTVMIWPVMPSTSEKLSEILGMDPPGSGLLTKPEDLLGLVPQGAQTTKPKALFPRVDTAKVKAKAAKAAAKTQEKKPARPKKKKAPQGPAPEVTIDEFARLDLKLGKVLEAENIKGADRILKLQIDLGEETPRQVVAGIALHYKPEDLVGKQVVVVANLKPVTLKGIESRGMVLTAVGDDTVRVVAPDLEFTPGSTVR